MPLVYLKKVTAAVASDGGIAGGTGCRSQLALLSPACNDVMMMMMM
jgi:hypothetical protein